MNRGNGKRYFDLSTLLALGLAALLLVSLPGGCGDDEESDSDEDVDTEAVAEATEVPMMDIVDPEPGDLDTEPVTEEQGEGEQDDGDEPVEEAPESSDDSDDQEAPEDQSGESDGSYVVQQGDTLYGIAVEFGVSMEDLMAANDMDNPDQLQVGQELQIP
jgi:LysM repeat protein